MCIFILYVFRSNNQVKHMKICERLEDGISSFYLSEKRFFPNLVELVNFYERNSLSENFTGYVHEDQ